VQTDRRTFLISPNGTRAWIEKICPVFGIEPKGLRAGSITGLHDHFQLIRASLFSMGDNYTSLARFLVRCGMTSGNQYLHG